MFGFEPELWDYLAFATIMLLVFSVVRFFVWLAGLPGRSAVARKHPEAEAVKMMGWAGWLPTVLPWVQAFMWAFKPTDVVEIRRFPPDVERTTELEIATAQQAKAVAAYGGAAGTAFREVEDALGNESLIANHLQ
jgi:hypothetical protein